jgi:2-phosphoglycerate kinase
MTKATPKAARRRVLVRDGDHGLPFSKGLTANTIIVSGLSPARAYHVAQVIEDQLVDSGRESIDVDEFRDLTAATIRTEAGERYAEAYAKWQDIGSLDVPLIILIGGATGVGKSTIATQLAARLSIVRVISTDAIREVMKSTFSRDFMPTLYTSSFDAADVVNTKVTRGEDGVLVGFRDQVSAVAVGVNALIERAVTESTDVVIEGAHIAPGFVDPQAFGDKAVIVPIVIQVEDEDLHRSHFYVRAHDTRARPVERYLAHFGNIRRIQKYIKSLALQHGVPVISNYNLDACLRSVIDHVIDSATVAAKNLPRRRGVRAIRGGAG